MSAPLYIAADHAGYDRKAWLVGALAAAGCPVVDLGPSTLAEDDDYPDYALPLARRVVAEQARGILLCGNGQGMCIVANKVPGVRAVSALSPEMARTTRSDDNANILCLPGRFQTNDEILAIVTAWLTTPFSGAERHLRRIEKIQSAEAAHGR